MTHLIVDTHTHVVSFDHARYPIEPPDGLPRMPWFDEHPVDASGLLAAMDTAGVRGAVLVQAKGAYGFDNSYAADARAIAPDRFWRADRRRSRPIGSSAWSTGRERGCRRRGCSTSPSSPSWLDAPAAAVLAKPRSRLRVALCISWTRCRGWERCVRGARSADRADHCGRGPHDGARRPACPREPTSLYGGSIGSRSSALSA
jgi:hypothetical protein